jgi:glutaminyl-tRNA synthetase
MRRRGYTPKAIKNFSSAIGLAKADSTVDFSYLEHFVRDDLNKTALRRMAVINPLKVIIVNYPEGLVEEMDAVNNPEDTSSGTRKVPFSREIYIEKDDFMENPPSKFYRLSPGSEVRLRYAYFIKCMEVKKDPEGNITGLYCTYDPATKGGDSPDGRKVKSTLHWVSSGHAVDIEVRLYDKLFMVENPLKAAEGRSFPDNLNPNSLKIVNGCKAEPSVKSLKSGDTCQFERIGYFCADKDFTSHKPVFNLTVTLKDEWSKIKAKL